MSEKTIDHPKSHFKKWDKHWQLTVTYRLAGYHGAHYVETSAPPPAPVSQKITKLHAQLQEMQLTLSAQRKSVNTVPGTLSFPSMQITVATGTDTDSTVPTEQMAYFWMHGPRKNAEHCSTTFRNCAVRHQDTATFHKNLGGSSRVYRKRNTIVPR